MSSYRAKDARESASTGLFQPGKAWRTVAILFLLAVASFLDRMVISMLVEPIKRDLHLSDTQFSLAQGGAFALAFALGAIPLGMAIDRYSRRHVLFICILVWTVGCVSAGFATGVVSLIGARMLVGIGEAAMTPAAASIIGDNFPDDRAGTALGIYGASGYVGYGVSMALGGALIAYLGAQGGFYFPLLGTLAPWRATFVIVGLPVFFLAFLAFFMNDSRASAGRSAMTRQVPVGWSELYRTRRGALAGLLIGISALTGAFSTVAAWTPAYLIRKFHMPVTEIGLALGIGMGVLAALGSVIGGVVISRMVRSGITNAAFIVGIAVGIVSGPLFVAAHLVDNATTAVVLLDLGLLAFGGLAAVNYAAIQAIAPPRARGKAAALVALACAFLSYALAPLLVAVVTDHVLHDTNEVGLSLAIVQAVLVVLGVSAFAAGLAPLRQLANPPSDNYASAVPVPA